MSSSKPFVPIIHGAVLDRPDEADTLAVAAEIAAALQRLGYVSEIVALGLDLSVLDRLAARKPLAVFNLVESLAGDDALAALPCAVMDHLGLAYTGADARAYAITLSKLLSKERLQVYGLSTAPWWRDGRDVPPGETVIVKSATAHASLGLDSGSVVSGVRAAREIAEREARFGGRFFAERFVEGREFNVALIEDAGAPRVLPIPEIVFDVWPEGRPHIMDYETKWSPESAGWRGCARTFGLETREPVLAVELGRLALGCWKAVGLAGYARVDVRLGEHSEPFILEVNANPCLARDAGFAATAAEAGIAYDDLIRLILATATKGAGQ